MLEVVSSAVIGKIGVKEGLRGWLESGKIQKRILSWKPREDRIFRRQIDRSVGSDAEGRVKKDKDRSPLGTAIKRSLQNDNTNFLYK